MSHMKNRDANKVRREQRQSEAKVRKEAYSLLTPKQRLAKLDAGNEFSAGKPLVATAQRARIAAAVSASKQEHAKKVEAAKPVKPTGKKPQARA